MDQKISISDESVGLSFGPFRMVHSEISTLRNEMNRFRILRVADEDDSGRGQIELSQNPMEINLYRLTG
jgi:hypothetical protein